MPVLVLIYRHLGAKTDRLISGAFDGFPVPGLGSAI